MSKDKVNQNYGGVKSESTKSFPPTKKSPPPPKNVKPPKDNTKG